MEFLKFWWLLCYISITQYVEQVNSANILAIVFFSSKSHKLTYTPLIEQLGKRGHNVTFVSPIKATREMENVHEIFTLDVEQIFRSNKFDPFQLKANGSSIDAFKGMQMVGQACSQSLDLPQVKNLLNQKFDLIFTQPIQNDCVLALIYRLQTPFVLFTPLSTPSFYINKLGGHFPYSTTPNFLLGYTLPMSFLERFKNFGFEIITQVFLGWIYEPKMEKLYREKLGNDIPSVNEIVANASLVLSNGHFSLNEPRPHYPDVVDVGGIHCREAGPVDKDIENFIGRGQHGFILFSMGTAIQGDMMPDEKRKIILKVFSGLKQQVLWKWESETMADLPKNVKLSKWLPQQDLFGRNDIKMFITHCGGGSTEEAVYHGVPLVGIPMMGDQPQNSRKAREKGFLVELEWNELTEENFEGAIKEVLHNPVYRNNVKRLSTLLRDRPVKPLDLGVYWIEYVLRHNGAEHLRSFGRKLSFVQYHSIDVMLAHVVLLSGMVYLFYRILKFVFGWLICTKRTTKFGMLISEKKIQ